MITQNGFCRQNEKGLWTVRTERARDFTRMLRYCPTEGWDLVPGTRATRLPGAMMRSSPAIVRKSHPPGRVGGAVEGLGGSIPSLYFGMAWV